MFVQGWIFLRIHGYSVREKFPIFAGSEKSFLISRSGILTGFSQSEQLLQSWKLSPDTFPKKRIFASHLFWSEISMPRIPFQVTDFSAQKPFAARDFPVPRKHFPGTDFSFLFRILKSRVQAIIFWILQKKYGRICAPFSGKSLLLWKWPSGKSFQYLVKYSPLSAFDQNLLM